MKKIIIISVLISMSLFSNGGDYKDRQSKRALEIREEFLVSDTCKSFMKVYSKGLKDVN